MLGSLERAAVCLECGREGGTCSRHVLPLPGARHRGAGGGAVDSQDLQGQRTVHCAEALEWLGQQGVLAGCSLVTSLPDVSELGGLSLGEWRAWFVRAARRVMASC